MELTLGVVGVGRMGLAICERLGAAGFKLGCHDHRPERERQVRAAGARWVADLALLVASSDVLITVLPGSDELSDVMERAIPALRRGMTWLDMTSAAPDVGRALMTTAEESGVECLEATAGGDVTAGRAGALQLFVGGPADRVARHRWLLETLGTVEHVGGHGAGYLTKLLVNFLWFTQAVAMGEALLQARSAGLDLDAVTAAIGRGPAASAFADRDLPALRSANYLPSYGLDRCCAQLDALVATASRAGLPFELTATVRDAYADALARYGPVDGELLAVKALEERAGLALRDDPA